MPKGPAFVGSIEERLGASLSKFRRRSGLFVACKRECAPDSALFYWIADKCYSECDLNVATGEVTQNCLDLFLPSRPFCTLFDDTVRLIP